MKVKELVATLLTLPQEATVYTEQFNCNEIAEVAVNRSEDYVIIGDDLDAVIEETGSAATFTLDAPITYVVRLESFDEGIPYHYIECYSTYKAAKEALAALVADEKELRYGHGLPTDRVQIIDEPDYYSWHNHTKGNYSEIWIQENVIWDKTIYTTEQE